MYSRWFLLCHCKGSLRITSSEEVREKDFQKWLLWCVMGVYKDGESLAIMSQMVAWTSLLLGTVACSDLDCSKRNEKNVRSFHLNIRKHVQHAGDEALTPVSAQRGCGTHWRCSKSVCTRPGPQQSVLGGPAWAGRLYRDHLQGSLPNSAVLWYCFFASLTEVSTSTLGSARTGDLGKCSIWSAWFCNFCLGLTLQEVVRIIYSLCCGFCLEVKNAFKCHWEK